MTRYTLPKIWLCFVAARLIAADAPTPQVPEEGIPVTSQLVISRCGSCHAKDEKGNLRRISWERGTPEAWEEAIKRMVRLQGVRLTPEEAHSILKYLATDHGLAPEEANPIQYYAERRMQDETNIPSDKVRGACTNCHPLARPLSWRRSQDDWRLLANMHVALYASAEEAFRRGLGVGSPLDWPRKPAETRPVDEAIAYLSKTAPLHTAEWSVWRARMHTPKLDGRWVVSAYIPGRGKFFGEMDVKNKGGMDEEFTTRVKLTSAKDGTTISHEGYSIVYAGYQWRGRSKGTPATNPSPDDLGSEMREVMSLSADQSSAQGRWFWGQYQEFGFDVKMQRASADPTLIGVDGASLKTGSQANRLRLFAESVPDQIAPADLDFGTGVMVKRILSHTLREIVAEVDVAADAVPGKRDIAFKRSVLPSAIAVYDRVDYIKVTPDSALARLGSEKHPKGYQQFEAIGYQRGIDGQINASDDVELGPVDVKWSVEEFYSVDSDDDREFVGSLSDTGFFTPSSDGPNPQRKFSRNNYGDVWIVATAKDLKDKDGAPLMGKSYLVVTVPAYMQWDQPEVSQ